MDSYLDSFMKAGGSFVSLAKGNRSSQVTKACKTYGGFYLGSIGGPAAILAKNCIKKVDVLEYPELGMEAVWKIEVQDFPAFVVIDDKGNDFFKQWIDWHLNSLILSLLFLIFAYKTFILKKIYFFYKVQFLFILLNLY